MNDLKFIILCCLFPLAVFAQEETPAVTSNSQLEKQISFRELTVEKGLSQNSVVSITQDSIGYMWFATQDGLNIYDGKTFTHFNKQFVDITRSTYSKLGKVYVDRQNAIWIIPLSGVLEKLESKSNTFEAIPGVENASSVFQDTTNSIWVITYGNGIYRINKETNEVEHFNKKQLEGLDMYHIFQDRDTTITVTTNNGVFSFDPQFSEITQVPVRSAEGKDLTVGFSYLVSDRKQTQWLGAFEKGLFFKKVQDHSFNPFHGFNDANSVPDNLNILSLLFDKQERLWLATYGQGVFLIDFSTQKIQNFKVQGRDSKKLYHNDILCLYQDYTGTIWFGTDGAGLSFYDEHLEKFNVRTNEQIPENINIDFVRAITVDEKGIVWLGTFGKGLTQYNPQDESWKTYISNPNKLNSISSNRIISLYNQNNELWIGFQDDGLNILKNGVFQKYNSDTKIKLPASTIWKIFKDSKDQIWFGTRDEGLILFDKDKGVLKLYMHDKNDPNSLPENNIRTISEDQQGNLWIGTNNSGICYFNTTTETFTTFTNNKTNANSLSNNSIKSLYFAPDKILWIGTNGGGLNAYDTTKKKFFRFSKEQGLPNNVIYGILPDGTTDLWLSSNYGLTKFGIPEDLETERPDITNYSNYDGLQSLEFNTGAYYKDQNGFFYFGGLKGLNWFKPGQLSLNKVMPKTVISQVAIFNEPIAITEHEKFQHNENTFDFTFSSLHFSQPERNSYKYRLVGHDANWISSGNINTTHYTNLPPNDYEFKVISSNYDGVWNNTPATYSFTILKPWYATNFALVIYGLLLLLSAFLTYKYAKWRWQIKMQLQFEHQETERLKKLDDFKSKLYTNISHEFRTPLTLISGPIDKHLSKPNLSEEDKNSFALIQRNSHRLLNLVNQLLDLSKLESGALKLNASKGNLSLLLKNLATAFEYKAKEKQLVFSYHIAKAESAWFDRDVVEKIVTNLLSNAIKYTPEKGTVSFEANEQGGQIILTVINNGNTLSNQDLPKLFERFYQSLHNSEGAGIGLALVKELAVLSHGNIIANTINEDEIQFTVTLPIEQSFFSPNEITFQEPIEIRNPIKPAAVQHNNHPALKNDELPLLLIIDDDADIREFISSIFIDSYRIKEAKNGEQGINRAFKYIPDLIISDIMMPVTDGIGVCNRLKYDPRTSHIPIILLTAKVGDQNELIGLKTGADDYITKPFNSDKLKIRVDKLIELRRQLQKRYQQEFEFQSGTEVRSTVEQQFLKQLHELLDAHISDPEFKSDVFCKKMLMSRMQLHRKLKALTGLSTSEFLKSQRVKLAATLLKESDLSISEIAYQVGFNTPSYFSKCFKEIYKCTPIEYVSE